MQLQLEFGNDNPTLRKKAQEVDFNNPQFDIELLSQNMIETMQKEKGVGLAAPQIGELYRIIAIGSEKEPFIMINPEITFESKETSVVKEGCLSLPGEEYPVERSKKIRFKYYDSAGNKNKSKAKGLLARVIQHEIDHLNGILITDKVYEG